MENNINKQITNLSYLLSLSKGDKGFVKNMINVFLEENPKEVNNLEQSINEKDFDKIKAAAHKLKSTIPFVGLDAVIGEEVAEIESLATNKGGLKEIKSLYVKVKESSDIACKELQEYLAQ